MSAPDEISHTEALGEFQRRLGASPPPRLERVDAKRVWAAVLAAGAVAALGLGLAYGGHAGLAPSPVERHGSP